MRVILLFPQTDQSTFAAAQSTWRRGGKKKKLRITQRVKGKTTGATGCQWKRRASPPPLPDRVRRWMGAGGRESVQEQDIATNNLTRDLFDSCS